MTMEQQAETVIYPTEVPAAVAGIIRAGSTGGSRLCRRLSSAFSGKSQPTSRHPSGPATSLETTLTYAMGTSQLAILDQSHFSTYRAGNKLQSVAGHHPNDIGVLVVFAAGPDDVCPSLPDSREGIHGNVAHVDSRHKTSRVSHHNSCNGKDHEGLCADTYNKTTGMRGGGGYNSCGFNISTAPSSSHCCCCSSYTSVIASPTSSCGQCHVFRQQLARGGRCWASGGKMLQEVAALSRCYLLVLLLLTAMSRPVTSHPLREYQALPQRNQGFVHQPEPFDSTNYLAKLGYLPRSDLETGAMRNRTELESAIKKFQTMAHLPVTGRLDQATTDKMQDERCGVGDNVEYYESSRDRVKRYVLGPSTWAKKDLTYRILNYSPDLSNSQIRYSLERAFRVWSDVTELTFTERQHEVADIMIKFAHSYHQDGYPFDGKGMTLAHAFFPGEDNGGDVHFDEDERWTYEASDGVNLFMVAAHEIGHALGLAHSSVKGSLMYPWYQGYESGPYSLPGDDRVAIQYLYGAKDTVTYYPPGGYTTTTTTRRPYHPTPPYVPPVTAQPHTPTPEDGSSSPPDICNSGIDAAALIRTEAYLFKGNWFWRIDEEGLMDGYPVQMQRFWYGLPDSIQHVDAVYERHEDGKIVFFNGPRYWVFNGNHMDTGFPAEGRPLTHLGLPGDIDKVDAAFVWGYNLQTYFITGSMYWKYIEETSQMAFDYPRDMSMWDGVPIPLDAAFKFWDGVTYFFQGTNFWKFKDALMRVEDNYPKSIGPFWLECSYDAEADPNVGTSSISSTITMNTLCLICCMLLHGQVLQKVLLRS